MSNITDGADLLFQRLGGEQNIGVLLNLEKLKPGMLEIEHKYRIHEEPGRSDGGFLSFSSTIDQFLRDRNALVDTIYFTGIDQYYVVESPNGLTVTYRFRLGVNKLPELTAKFATTGNGNEIRGEINLDVSENEPEQIIGMLTLISFQAKNNKQFAVRQDGFLAKVTDPEHGRLEIVNYRVGGIKPRRERVSLVEIESKVPNAEKALQAIGVYEEGLGLADKRCEQSIAEMFAPKD